MCSIRIKIQAEVREGSMMAKLLFEAQLDFTLAIAVGTIAPAVDAAETLLKKPKNFPDVIELMDKVKLFDELGCQYQKYRLMLLYC
ncbi:hypothetical protein TSAR_012925 [Trichomalopsis sarcophagae]|uniref:Uncharacterized protein n=1 Tax=Trichomalopsis sarcophagae TaxID=543379 RepID=A0A232F432_9HYME|nr:hypothetical protein TSAR_012925 [Trichomalopsis sarcophagae]